MSQSEQEVFDFDAIKGQYVKRCIPQVKPQPASNDALWLDTNYLFRAVYTLNRQEFEDYVIREGKAGSS